ADRAIEFADVLSTGDEIRVDRPAGAEALHRGPQGVGAEALLRCWFDVARLRQIFGWSRQSLQYCGDDLAAVGLLDGTRQAAHTCELFDGFDWRTGQIEQHFVLEKRTCRDIVLTGASVAPDGQLAQRGLVSRRQSTGPADAVVIALRVKDV